MKLYEYQAKELFEQNGIPTAPGKVIEKPEEAYGITEELGGSSAIKAQVLIGGRGKAGGVKIASSPDEAVVHARSILKMQLKSMPVKKALVVKALPILSEYYIGITVDRSLKMVVLIISAEGGVDIEELAAHNPEKIHTIPIHPLKGLDEKKCRSMVTALFGDTGDGEAFETVKKLYRLFVDIDGSLVEINPYAHTKDDGFFALDAKIVVDENALYKHPEIEKMRNPEEYGPDELEARGYGLSFVSLDGDIGCIVNGAGLAMATMDIIKLAGGSPANFLDVGGSSSPEKVVHAFEIITRNKNVQAILINIFGGITRCDDIAKGILQARKTVNLRVPLVIRLIGTNEKEGQAILKKEGIDVFETLTDAVDKVVHYSRERT
jgi:succinyl-CoA synthetase beta subunit